MRVRAKFFITACWFTSLQNINANIVLSLKVTAQRDMALARYLHVRYWLRRLRMFTTCALGARGSNGRTPVSFFAPALLQWLATITGPGTARRRRDRQLRLFLRQERMTVWMVLSEALLHHSAQSRPTELKADRIREGEVNEEYFAARRQTTPPPGMRPSVFAELVPQEFV